MSSWVIRTNIADFRRKIAAETDLDKRRILEELLVQEETKLKQGAEKKIERA